MTAGELLDIAVQVLWRHDVTGAHMGPFEDRPEGLEGIGGDRPAGVFAAGMIDGAVDTALTCRKPGLHRCSRLRAGTCDHGRI